MEPWAIVSGAMRRMIKPPESRERPLTSMTKAPPQASCVALCRPDASARSEGTQFPRLSIDP